MPALLAAIEQALAGILNILGISQLMYGLLQQFGVVVNTTAKEHFPFEVQGLGLAANNQLADPTFGLAAIKTELDGIGLAIIALGNPQQTAQPVTLPTVPPAGYGGATATDVWSYVLPTSGATTGEQLDNAGMYAVALADRPWPRLPGQPYLKLIVHFNWIGVGFYVPDPRPPLDVTTILPTDATPAAWVLREYASYGWVTVNQSGDWQPLAYHDLSTTNVYFALDMSQAEFLEIQVLLYPPAGPIVPPVWPGLVNVTYGAPQSMDAPNGTLTGPADGYKIVIDTQPSWAGKFDFGSIQAWRNVGAIAFLDDETIPEPAQTLGLASVIYTPQRMAHAAGALYRIATGYHATATPYVINS